MHALPCSLYTIYSSQGMKTTKVSTDGWKNKEIMVCINNEFYPDIKKNEILPFMKIWRDPKSIMLKTK